MESDKYPSNHFFRSGGPAAGSLFEVSRSDGRGRAFWFTPFSPERNLLPRVRIVFGFSCLLCSWFLVCGYVDVKSRQSQQEK